VYKTDTDKVEAFIDISAIPELSSIATGPSSISLGGGVTLAQAIRTLKETSATPGFQYTLALSKHLKRVANVPVRNVLFVPFSNDFLQKLYLTDSILVYIWFPLLGRHFGWEPYAETQSQRISF
jgi:hypothetical protein